MLYLALSGSLGSLWLFLALWLSHALSGSLMLSFALSGSVCVSLAIYLWLSLMLVCLRADLWNPPRPTAAKKTKTCNNDCEQREARRAEGGRTAGSTPSVKMRESSAASTPSDDVGYLELVKLAGSKYAWMCGLPGVRTNACGLPL